MYWAANYYGIKDIIPPARTIDHDRVRADLTSGLTPLEVAAAHGISAASVYRIHGMESAPNERTLTSDTRRNALADT